MKLPDTITVGANDLARNPWTVSVRYSGPLRFRFWLAKTLIRLAAWLAGGRADVARDDWESV